MYCLQVFRLGHLVAKVVMQMRRHPRKKHAPKPDTKHSSTLNLGS